MANTTKAMVAVGGVALTLCLAAKVYNIVRSKDSRPESATNNKKVINENDTFESHVCEHDGNGLVTLSPGRLWHVTAKFHGNGPPWRRMVVYRPPDTSSLILLSPTAVPEDVMSAIDNLGSVDILLIPNSYHRADSAVFKARYPNAKVASPPSWVRTAISEVVPVDMDARELAERYKESVRVVRIGGLSSENSTDFEYAYEFQCSDGTWAYAVTDTLFNFPEAGFMNWVFGCRGIVQPDGSTTPRVGRISKWLMHSRSDNAKFYQGMSERDDISMIVMAHGDVLVGGTKEAFSAIAKDLYPS